MLHFFFYIQFGLIKLKNWRLSVSRIEVNAVQNTDSRCFSSATPTTFFRERRNPQPFLTPDATREKERERERKHPAIHLRRTKYDDPLSWPNANLMQILRRIPTMGRPSDMVMSSHVDPDEHTASPAARAQDCTWCSADARVFEICYTLLPRPTGVCAAEKLLIHVSSVP